MIYTALILGLISSLHCIGMCGPIAMMLPVSRENTAKKFLQIGIYQLGRLSAYGTLGLIFGLLGKGLFIAGMQQQLSIIVGVLMITLVVVPERVFMKYNFSKPIYLAINKVKSHIGFQFKRKSPDALFTIGFFNGLLPCAMVYSALFGAVAMQNPLLGIGYMVLFGIGTMPLMTLVVFAANKISFQWRNKVQKVIPVMLVLVAIMFIVRGLGLDIPMFSPTGQDLMVTADPDCVFP